MSGDLFGRRLLVERQAFMEAQAQALESQRHTMTEAGWSEVVIGRREDVQDRLYAMDTPEREFDEQTTRKLAKVASRRVKLEATAQKIDEGDEPRIKRLFARADELQAQEQEIVEQAPEFFSEETRAVATAFLILDPDGRVHREYRIPKRSRRHAATANGGAVSNGDGEKPKPPSSDDLSDRQLAVTFTHQAVAVRETLLKNTAARKRVLRP